MTNGREHGDWVYWYEDGVVAAEGAYANGLEEGTWKLFHPNGKLATEIHYEDGKPLDGELSEVFDDEGNLTRQDVPVADGGTIGIWFHANGSKMSEGKSNPYEEGVWTSWYETGQKRLENEFLSGDIHGYYRTWYENGQAQSDSMWIKDKPHGQWTDWYESGQPKRQGSYSNGGTVGRWQFWNEDGSVLLDVDFGEGIQIPSDPEPVWGFRERVAQLFARLTRRNATQTFNLDFMRTWDEWETLATSVNSLEGAAFDPIRWQLQEGYMARDLLEVAAFQVPQLKPLVESLDDKFRESTAEASIPLEPTGKNWWWKRRPLNSLEVEADETGWGKVGRGKSGRLQRWRG
jgi:antitoxin component YwqK of YwqJK toxin-antitoxin module